MRGLWQTGLLLAPIASALAVPSQASGAANVDVPSIDSFEPDVDVDSPKEWRGRPFPHWKHHKNTATVAIEVAALLASAGVDEPTTHLKFNLEVKDSERICGDGNFLVNGQKLGQEHRNDKAVGNGTMSVDGHEIEASWVFNCIIGLDDRPKFRFVTFNINSVDKEAVADEKTSLGFTAQFQQQSERTKIMSAIPDVYRQAPNPRLEYKWETEREERGPTVEELYDDIHFLKHQMRELKWQIREKKGLVHELIGGHPRRPAISECDSLKCVCKALVHKAKGLAHHVSGNTFGGIEQSGRPGPPRGHNGGRHHKHEGKVNHFNKHNGSHPFPHPPNGNHSFPHPPHRGPPHHHHQRLPVCRFPPPPRHMHHGPPPFGGSDSEMLAHAGKPKQHTSDRLDSPSEWSDRPEHHGMPPLDHLGDHPSSPPHHKPENRPPHGHKPEHEGKHGERPSPQPQEHKITEKGSGDSGYQRGPGGPGGPPHGPSPFSNEHDHFEGPGDARGPFDHQGPPPLIKFLHALKIVVAGAILVLLVRTIHSRCCCASRKDRAAAKAKRREERREHRLRRKEERKQAWRDWALGLVRNMGVALPMSDEDEADYEEKRAMLMEEAQYDARLGVDTEIDQLVRAADVVGSMVERHAADNRELIVHRASFETALPDYESRSQAGGDLPDYEDDEAIVGSLIGDGYRPGGHHYSPSNVSSDAGSVRDIIGDVKN